MLLLKVILSFILRFYRQFIDIELNFFIRLRRYPLYILLRLLFHFFTLLILINTFDILIFILFLLAFSDFLRYYFIVISFLFIVVYICINWKFHQFLKLNMLWRLFFLLLNIRFLLKGLKVIKLIIIRALCINLNILRAQINVIISQIDSIRETHSSWLALLFIQPFLLCWFYLFFSVTSYCFASLSINLRISFNEFFLICFYFLFFILLYLFILKLGLALIIKYSFWVLLAYEISLWLILIVFYCLEYGCSFINRSSETFFLLILDYLNVVLNYRLRI